MNIAIIKNVTLFGIISSKHPAGKQSAIFSNVMNITNDVNTSNQAVAWAENAKPGDKMELTKFGSCIEIEER